MVSLDFGRMQEIKEILSGTVLDDLVGILAQTSNDQLLLVYNADVCPAPTAKHNQAIGLDSLAEVDLQQYDGLFVGISALDVIRDDLVTKGSTFYPLEQLFLELGQRPVLHHTLHNLARYLVTFLHNLPPTDPVRHQRVVIKILQLALPALLDQRHMDTLIAVLPGSSLAGFVAGTGGQWLTASSELDSLGALDEAEWIVALQEVAWFDAGVQPGSRLFIELRSVLHQVGQGDVLHRTYRTLARRCAGEATDRPALWEPAWKLVAEDWLSGEDVADLVAFFPHAEFEHFARTGEGLRIYRVLDEAARRVTPGPRWPLADLLSQRLPPEFRRYGFALVPLDTIAPPAEDGPEPFALGRLLWRAGQGQALARTLLLLARDGLAGVSPADHLPASVLSDLARRAMMLVTLGDPWRWRQGRYAQLAATAYQVLQQALERQGDSAPEDMNDYYQAVLDWYRCYEVRPEDMNELLRQIATQLRTFLRAGHEDERDDYRVSARQLIEIEEAVLYPLALAGAGEELYPRLGTRVLPSDVGRVHGMIARQMSDAECLSPMFEPAWGQLRHLRNERHQVQVNERNLELQQRKLKGLLAHAERSRRLLFAPPHEMTVLRLIYDREIDDLARRVHELETEARLEIVPLNPRVEFQREVELVFEVHNSGRVEARDVEIVLARDPGFELLDRSSIHELPRLLPGVPHRISYHVRAIHQPDVVLQFSYNYTGLDHSQEVPIQLPVRSLDETPFEMKGDPYKFGRAIQNPADFYGRGAEIKKMLASLYRGGHTNFLLRGPRRMGKTSLLHMIAHALERPDVRRRFGIPERWDAALERYLPIMLDLQAFSFQDDVTPIARFFHSLLAEVSAALVPERREALLADFDRRWQQIGAPRAVQEQLNMVFDAHPQVRVVVLLDEYDELYRPQGRALDTALRHVVQSEQRMTWIITSTQFLFKESKSHGSPWFNILDIVELDCLSKRAAQQLVEEPSRGERVEWQSDATVALLDETGRHPAFLQLFCSRIIAHLNQERQNYVLPQTIAALAEQIVSEQETVHSHFEFYWADTPGVGRLILLATDEGDRPPGRLDLQKWVQARLQARFGTQIEARVPDKRGDPIPWWEQEFEDGMFWVSNVVNAISFDRASRTFAFTVPLFRRWLQHKRQYEDLLESALHKVTTEMERDGLA